MLPQITVGGASILVIIGILVALLRQLGLPSRWLPLATILFGMMLGVIAYFSSGYPLLDGLIGGMIIGASVGGLYDFGKKTVLNK